MCVFIVTFVWPIRSSNFDLDGMTFICEGNLDIFKMYLHTKNEVYKLDTLRWFSQRRSPMPHFGGADPGGYDPQFELGRDFCTMRLLPSFIVFTCSEVVVLTNKQRNMTDTLTDAIERLTTAAVAHCNWVVVCSWAGWTFHNKLIKMLSVCVDICVSVWMLTRVEQIVTAACRDL